MRILVDQNIAPQIVAELNRKYRGSTHVRDVGLQSSTDTEVWEFAKSQGFAILSKDADFHQRSLVFGQPPKVIWIRRGNCTTATIITILADHESAISSFLSDSESAFLAIG